MNEKHEDQYIADKIKSEKIGAIIAYVLSAIILVVIIITIISQLANSHKPGVPTEITSPTSGFSMTTAADAPEANTAAASAPSQTFSQPAGAEGDNFLQGQDGNWYAYDANGQVDSDFTGIIQGEWGQFYVVNGKFANYYNGTMNFNGQDYNLVNGKVQ